MKYLLWLLKAAIFFTLFAFALNNQQDATVHFFFGTQWRAPLVLVVLIAAAVGFAMTRAITKPVAGTVTIALNGTPQASGWSVSTTTGLITFTTAPAPGVAITAGFEFDVPVRFDTDALDVTLDLERLGSITSIPLIELRL